MNWLRLIQILLPLILDWINTKENSGECPDGVCAPLRDELLLLQADVESPKLKAGIGDILSCLDLNAAFDAAKELSIALKAKDYGTAFAAGIVIARLIRDAVNGVCPDDDSKKVG